MSQVSSTARSDRRLRAASKRPVSNAQRLAVVGTLVFAAMLILSSWLKAENNSKAAQSLLWTGLDRDIRVLMIDVLGFVEAGIGAALVLFPRRKLVHSLAIVLAVGLATGHVLGMVKGAENCGCFGELDVPDWATLTGLGIGLVSSIVRLVGLRGVTGPSKVVALRFGLVLAGAVAAMYPWVNERLFQKSHIIKRDGQKVAATPAERLLQKLGIPVDAIDEEGVNMLIVVGRWSCDHCKAALEDFADKRKHDERVADLMFYFVVSDKDKGPRPTFTRGFNWMEVATIPDKLWWDLIIDTSPSYVRVKPGVKLEPSKKWTL